MKYILILVFYHVNGGVATTQLEFDTKVACEKAGEYAESKIGNMDYVCIEKPWKG